MPRHPAFPLALVTTGRHLLLVGGGPLGADRLRTALDYDWAQITMTAQTPTDLTPDIHALAADDPRVVLRDRPCAEADVATADLVIDSTTDEDLAATLSGWCRPRRVPLNAMDKMEYCDIHYPALITRGPLLLAIVSGGQTPALSGTLRRWLDEALGPGWEHAAQRLAEARRATPPGRRRMQMLIDLARDPRLLDGIRRDDQAAMQQLIDEAVRQEFDDNSGTPHVP